MCGRYELIDGQRVLVRFGATRSVQAQVQQAAIWDNRDVRPTQRSRCRCCEVPITNSR